MRASPAAKLELRLRARIFGNSFGATVFHLRPLPRSYLSSGDKVCPAAAVHPDAAIVISPCLPLNTRGTASLVSQLYSAAGVRRAVDALAVIGRAGDGSSPAAITRAAGTRSRAIIGSQVEIGPASPVHPNSLA